MRADLDCSFATPFFFCGGDCGTPTELSGPDIAHWDVVCETRSVHSGSALFPPHPLVAMPAFFVNPFACVLLFSPIRPLHSVSGAKEDTDRTCTEHSPSVAALPKLPVQVLSFDVPVGSYRVCVSEEVGAPFRPLPSATTQYLRVRARTTRERQHGQHS